MAGAFITIKLDGLEAAIAALDRLGQIDGNKKLLFADIGEGLLISTRERFTNQVAPDGSPWVALSAAYRKRKSPNADKILIWHGDLKGTLAYNATDDGLEFGSPRIYAAIQQFGGVAGRAESSASAGAARAARADAGLSTSRDYKPFQRPQLPARPFLGLSAEDSDMILAKANRFLERQANGTA